MINIEKLYKKNGMMPKKRSWLKTFIVVMLLFVGICYVLNPSRIYRYMFSREFNATVYNISSFSTPDSKGLETFAIELHTDEGKIYTATSNEIVWGITAKGDYVRVKLYPSAPWSSSGSSWVNARLINKLVKAKSKN